MRAVSLRTIAAVLLPAAACGPSVNEGACKDSLVAGDLVITEVFADYEAPAGASGVDDGKEWIELYNAADRPLDLTGLAIVHGRPDGSRQKSHVMSSVTLAPGQFFTLGNAAPDLVPAYIDYGYGGDLGDLFNSDGGKLELRCGDASIDAATYTDVEPGHSRQLTGAQAPDYTVNDDPTAWCEADATEFEPGNFGTPGQDNDCTPVVVGQCTDRGTSRAIDAPGPGQSVITEIMPSPAVTADTVGEWFEAVALRDLDLNGLGLDRAGDSTDRPDMIESAECLRVAAGTHVVFARSADPAMNGGLAVQGTFKFSLVGGSAASPGDIRILNGDAIVDAVAWTSSRNGHSLALDPDATNDTANDDAGNYCDGETAYTTDGTTTDYGTPGAPNDQCAAQPGAGQCLDGGVPRAIVAPVGGQLVITEFLANPKGTGTDATQEWFEIANVGAAAFDLNGLGLKGNAATVNVITAPECKTVPAGGYALFAHNADPAQNAMLPRPDATFSFALAQSNGSITVLDGAREVDKITWTNGITDGVARALQPGLTTSTANDDPASFCDAADPYGDGSNTGTPRAANACP